MIDAAKGPLPDEVKRPWRRFLEEYEPLRPDLYRYCRFLTRTPWDAEDLVQDTLARAFVTLGTMSRPPEKPRAWLFRVASNHWINQAKRSREEPIRDDLLEGGANTDRRATREAVGFVVGRLAPQERGAVILKDVFDFSLEEIAETLSTTVGAVKSALHRGRSKLSVADEPSVASVAPAVLDEFCSAFNARDVARLTSLLLDQIVVEFPGSHTEYGVEAARQALGALLIGDLVEPCGGVAPEQRHGMVRGQPRFEARMHRGTPIILCWWQHTDGEAVRAFTRVDCDGGGIALLRTYLHSPDAIEELCRELAVPFRTSGYRDWW
jgi:RNA polymerase sigma-70 factor (ECF subfamily)